MATADSPASKHSTDSLHGLVETFRERQAAFHDYFEDVLTSLDDVSTDAERLLESHAADQATASAGLERAREELAAERKAFDQAKEAWREELAAMLKELDERREQLIEEREADAERRAAWEGASADQQGVAEQLAKIMSDVDRVVQAAESLGAGADRSSDEDAGKLQDVLDRIGEQREAIESVVAAAKEQAERIEDVARRIEEQSAAAAQASSGEGADGEAAANFNRALERLEEELDASRKRLEDAESSKHEIEQQRVALENELRATRENVDQLNRTLESQREKAEQEKEGILDELRRMGEMLATLSKSGVQPAEAAPPSPSGTHPPRKPTGKTSLSSSWAAQAGNDSVPSSADPQMPPDPSADPLLQSVLSQFETLRQDLAKRSQSDSLAPPKVER